MKRKSILTVFVLAGTLFFFYVWSGLYLPRTNDAGYALFSIEPGQGVAQVARDLEEKGFIKSRWSFQVYVYLSGQYQNLQSGVYRLSAAQSVREIASVLARGKVFELCLSIPEGYNLEQIEQSIQESCQAQKVTCSFNLGRFRIRDFQDRFDFLKGLPADRNLEGFLFPDTYHIALYHGGQDIIQVMLKNFSDHLTEDIRNSIRERDKSIYEAVTVASLLEKEVTGEENKKMVAGIIWKRLEAGMPLEVDATLTYITGKPSQELTHQDMRLDSPYNTYRYVGLPPTPIANPGLESIKAAIYPQASSYWYYLTAPDGTVIYSQNLQEHMINKAKYL